MAISGRINLIKDPQKFFLPLLNGSKTPDFSAASPILNEAFTITMTGWLSWLPAPIPLPQQPVQINTKDGTFLLPEFPPEINPKAGVSLLLTRFGQPWYRSAVFSYARAQQGNLDIYVMPSSADVTAGTINGALSSAALPDNTNLSALPGLGFNVSGSQSVTAMEFGFKLVPVIAPNLGTWADLELTTYSITVGALDAACPNATERLQQIKSGLADEDSPLNKTTIPNTILNALESPLKSFFSGTNLTKAATTLFDDLSVTFSGFIYGMGSAPILVPAIWPLVGLSKSLVDMNVLKVNAMAGWPRSW